jgi:hypothetical protein
MRRSLQVTIAIATVVAFLGLAVGMYYAMKYLFIWAISSMDQ